MSPALLRLPQNTLLTKYKVIMHKNHNKIVLGPGVSFATWKMEIQAKLGRKNVLGHVFHTMTGIRPIKMPQDPETIDPANEDLAAPIAQYLIDLERVGSWRD